MAEQTARPNVVRAALIAYKVETEQYLSSYRSWPLTSPHDPACCDTCRLEHARWETRETTRKALVERLEAITDALAEPLAWIKAQSRCSEVANGWRCLRDPEHAPPHWFTAEDIDNA